MSTIYEIAREVLAEDARIAREAHEARMAAFDRIEAAFDREFGPLPSAAKPLSPTLPATSNTPVAGGDFSEVTK